MSNNDYSPLRRTRIKFWGGNFAQTQEGHLSVLELPKLLKGSYFPKSWSTFSFQRVMMSCFLSTLNPHRRKAALKLKTFFSCYVRHNYHISVLHVEIICPSFEVSSIKSLHKERQILYDPPRLLSTLSILSFFVSSSLLSVPIFLLRPSL